MEIHAHQIIVNKNLKVADSFAFILEEEYGMPMHVFDFKEKILFPEFVMERI